MDEFDEEEEEEEEYKPKKKGGNKPQIKGQDAKQGGQGGQNQEECKNNW